MKRIVFLFVLLFLVSCGTVAEAGRPTLVPTSTTPTIAPTPIPTFTPLPAYPGPSLSQVSTPSIDIQWIGYKQLRITWSSNSGCLYKYSIYSGLVWLTCNQGDVYLPAWDWMKYPHTGDQVFISTNLSGEPILKKTIPEEVFWFVLYMPVMNKGI